MFQFRTWIKSKEHPSNCYSCGGGKIGDKMTTIDLGGNCHYHYLVLCPKCRNTFAKKFWKFQAELKEEEKHD